MNPIEPQRVFTAAPSNQRRSTLSAPGRAWYLVGTFSVLLGVAHFDRFILSLLVTPITQEFGLTDQQMGFLLGFGFSLVYSIAGLPIAYYLDRGNRVYGVAAGVIVWSSATLGSGLAQSYEQLVMLRAGVAIGEAVLTPAMISLVADLFEPTERTRPTGFYFTAGTIMSGGAFIVGGLLIEIASGIHHLLPNLTPWRITLILVGLPGIILVLPLLATIAEPPRRGSLIAIDRTPNVSLVDHLRDHAGFYVPFYLVVGLGVSIGMAIFAWMPTVLTRSYGFDIAASGYVFGMAVTPSIVLGTIFWTWIVGRMDFNSGGPIFALMAAVVIIAAGAMINVIADSKALVVVACSFMAIGTASFTPISALVVQQIMPPVLHARLMATVLFAANVIGAGVGPLAPAWVSELWRDELRAMGWALFSYVVAVCVLLVPALLICWRAYTRYSAGRLASSASVCKKNL